MFKDDNELCGVEPVNKVWLDRLIEGLYKDAHICLEKVILFGSRVVNEHITWSDYDLCLISHDFKDMKPWERMEMVLREWQGERPLEPVCYTPEEFETLDLSLIEEIKIHGRVIYEKGLKPEGEG